VVETPERPRRRVHLVLVAAAVNVVLLLLVEGLASGVLIARLAVHLWRPLDERAHTQHDPELGWASVPGLDEPDMYGDGVSLVINAQGFRHHGDVGTRVPPGRSRVICSGDSFTFGPGVSNDETWCARLGRIDARIEPVNMGQLGYGVDQAFLWYVRDGVALDQDVHLFTAIAHDFERMRLRSLLSYGKPTLALEDGDLVARGTPVPHRSAFGVRLQSLAWLAGQTRFAELLRRVTGPRADGLAAPPQTAAADPLHPVVTRLFQTLADMHRARGSAVVVVFLPTREDYDRSGSEGWRVLVRDAARDHLPFIDLVAELRAVSPADGDRYFLDAADSSYGLAAGHYSPAGHEFIARALYRRLMALPLVRAKLDAAGGQSDQSGR
jgi:hypothetical protein